jgi:hypothetical protein
LSGPSPLYQPSFPTEFIAHARLLLRRRTAKAHLRQRASLALLRWAQGTFDLEDKTGRGRKPTFSPS